MTGHEGDARVGWQHAPGRAGGPRIARDELARREEALRSAPLFGELPKRHLRSIARVTGTARFREGETIVKEGATGSTFYVILDGAAKVVRGRRTVARLGAGDFFGEISLLGGGPRTATVLAEVPTVCLSLAGQDFRDILTREPALSLTILKQVGKRLRELQRPLVG